MQMALLGTALLMGLAAGPHCVAMCGAASAGVIRGVRAPAAAVAVPAGVVFQLGRLASYAVAGGLAAASFQGLALAGGQVPALRPLWVLLHGFVLAWGLLLVATGRQPIWAHRMGLGLATRLRTPRGGVAGLLAAGALWVVMPCGLLYSALMLAALANGMLEGAAAMALFAGGSALSLGLAPWLWQRLRSGGGLLSQAWGNRLAGALLALVALQALGIDLWHQLLAWCR
jgi:uncharacterized protein